MRLLDRQGKEAKEAKRMKWDKVKGNSGRKRGHVIISYIEQIVGMMHLRLSPLCLNIYL